MTLGQLAEQLNIYPSVIYIYLNNLKHNVSVSNSRISKIELSDNEVDLVLSNYITFCKDHNKLIHKLNGIRDNQTLTMDEIKEEWIKLNETHVSIQRYGCIYVFSKENKYV